MQAKHFYKAFVSALILTAAFIAFWEFYWRQKGFKISYNDDKVIWARARKHLTDPINQTVFIGDSRTKFDIDLSVWKELTGEDAVQLALVGSSPRPVLQSLVNDKMFKGKIIIGAADAALFNRDTTQREKSAKEAIEYFQTETPAQSANASLNYLLESGFVFLEEGKFGLNALLINLPISNRKNIYSPTGPPKELSGSTLDRQAYISNMFFADTSIRNSVIRYWTLTASRVKTLPAKGDSLLLFFEKTKYLLDQLRAKGCKIIFIRPPSGGSYLQREMKLYPRNEYWDKLLLYTQTNGFYYADYPETAVLVCPEESHLSPNDARIFTKTLIRYVKEKEHWEFPNH